MKTKNNSNRKIESKVFYTDAVKMIAEYKTLHGSDPDFLASEYFDKEAIQRILANPKCKGIGIFNAIKTEYGEKQNRLILMGLDENCKVLLNYKAGFSAVSAASIASSMVLQEMPYENGCPSPPGC